MKKIVEENRFSENMEFYFAYVKFGGLLEAQVEILSKHLYIDINMKIQIVASLTHRRHESGSPHFKCCFNLLI